MGVADRAINGVVKVSLLSSGQQYWGAIKKEGGRKKKALPGRERETVEVGSEQHLERERATIFRLGQRRRRLHPTRHFLSSLLILVQ